MTRIGISGGRASFSEEAAHEYAREENFLHADFDYLVSVERVLEALNSGHIQLGIFPVQSSSGGALEEALHAMSFYNFSIKKIFTCPTRHFFMILPEAQREDIAVIVSHPAALRECSVYLEREWPGAERKEYHDTARSAQDLRAGILSADTAVIAPRAAADLYDLRVLDANIADHADHLTTFLAVEPRS